MIYTLVKLCEATNFNPLPTKVANMQLLDHYALCAPYRQTDPPTHGDVPRQGDKTCFFAKSRSVFAPSPQQNP